MTIVIGDRFYSGSGNTFRVIEGPSEQSSGWAGCIRENAAGKWDDGKTHWWHPAALEAMKRLPRQDHPKDSAKQVVEAGGS